MIAFLIPQPSPILPPLDAGVRLRLAAASDHGPPSLFTLHDLKPQPGAVPHNEGYQVPHAFGLWSPERETQLAGLRQAYPDLSPCPPSTAGWFAVLCRAATVGVLDAASPDLRRAHGRHVAEIFPRMALGLRLNTAPRHRSGRWDALYILAADTALQALSMVEADPYTAAGIWMSFSARQVLAAEGAWIEATGAPPAAVR